MPDEYLTWSFKFKILPGYQKMIDPPTEEWPTHISPKILKLRFSLHMVKDDISARYEWPVSYLKFES